MPDENEQQGAEIMSSDPIPWTGLVVEEEDEAEDNSGFYNRYSLTVNEDTSKTYHQSHPFHTR